MNYFVINAFLALVWALLSGVFTLENLVIGYTLGYAVLYAARDVIGPTRYFSRVRQTAVFILYVLKEILLANLRVAAEVITPRHTMQPRILAVPTRAESELEMTLLVILISLTPGTLVLDISTDRRVVFVHHMVAADAQAAVENISTELEPRLLAVLRGRPPERKEEPA